MRDVTICSKYLDLTGFIILTTLWHPQHISFFSFSKYILLAMKQRQKYFYGSLKNDISPLPLLLQPIKEISTSTTTTTTTTFFQSFSFDLLRSVFEAQVERGSDPQFPVWGLLYPALSMSSNPKVIKKEKFSPSQPEY